MVEATANDGKDVGDSLFGRDTIIVGDPLISDGRSGSHPANSVFELSRLIKRISGRTGASLWFRRYTCGFSIAQLQNDDASSVATRRR